MNEAGFLLRRAGRGQGVLPVWLMGGTAGLCCLGVLSMVILLASNSMGYFWPAALAEFEVIEFADEPPLTMIGRLSQVETVPAEQLRDTGEEVPPGVQLVDRWLVKIGNRDLGGLDFQPVPTTWVVGAPADDPQEALRYPADLAVLERQSWGDAYGRVLSVSEGEEVLAQGEEAWQRIGELLPAVQAVLARARALERGEIRTVARRMQKLQRDREAAALLQQQRQYYDTLEDQLHELRARSQRYSLVLQVADGEQSQINLAQIVRIYRPNALSLPQQLGVFFAKLWEFLSAEPREANTEGGVFPAIFGTVAMVLLMTVLVAPFGVAAAFYLREYSNQGVVVRIIRISINNLAGVPSIVFGIFGLGFFVYGLGGEIDELFFSSSLPNPTFGTPGVFWAALTMALLTLPVVVVATEEGLARVPNNIRHGALALGSTHFEMLSRTVFPMAIPGILTGLILAVARAAGEVAPLVLVGAVKFAPTLPLDGEFPYVHLERKFMHLGYHIYDAGFQSPNAEAAQPLVYATALLLVVIILALNLSAMLLRNSYRERFIALEV